MADFQGPKDLKHNRGLIADPATFARDAGAASWLYLCGEEFAASKGGMSFAEVQSAVPESVNLIADPPRPFDMDVARRGVAALDEFSAEEVLACAEAEGAPFIHADPLVAWVVRGLTELS